MVRAEEVFDVLRQVKFPELELDIVTLGYVKEVGLEGGRVQVHLEVGPATDPRAAEVIEEQARLKLAAAGITHDLTFSVAGPAADAGGARPAAGQGVPFEDVMPQVRHKIAVASGKGGVGKSTVAVNLALALAKQGHRVGLLDADVYGPSLPMMLGVAGLAPQPSGDKVAPIATCGLKAMSLGFLAAGTEPVIWRGPLAGRAITQLMEDVDWSGVDILVMDMPPGTGDIQISVAQKGNLSGAVMVTTPQDVALVDAIKGVRMFQKVEIPVLGIVENMSHFACPHCGESSTIFPRGALYAELEELGVPIVGRIPVDPAVPAGGDMGRPIVLEAPDSVTAKAFFELAERVQASLGAEARS